MEAIHAGQQRDHPVHRLFLLQIMLPEEVGHLNDQTDIRYNRRCVCVVCSPAQHPYQCVGGVSRVEGVQVHELHSWVGAIDELLGSVPEALVKPQHHLVVSAPAQPLARLLLGGAQWRFEGDAGARLVAGLEDANRHSDDGLQGAVHLPVGCGHLHVAAAVLVVGHSDLVDNGLVDDVVLERGRIDEEVGQPAVALCAEPVALCELQHTQHIQTDRHTSEVCVSGIVAGCGSGA